MALSPRERILLEHLVSGVLAEDPEFAERLSEPLRPPTWPVWVVVVMQVLSVLAGVALVVLAAAVQEPGLALVGMAVAVAAPFVVALRSPLDLIGY